MVAVRLALQGKQVHAGAGRAGIRDGIYRASYCDSAGRNIEVDRNDCLHRFGEGLPKHRQAARDAECQCKDRPYEVGCTESKVMRSDCDSPSAGVLFVIG